MDIKKVISEMTLEEKASLLTASAFSTEMTVIYIGVGLILGLAVGSLSAIAVIKRRKNKVLVN